MALNKNEAGELARILADTAKEKTTIEPITSTRELTVQDGYDIQRAWVAEHAGSPVVGIKVGMAAPSTTGTLGVTNPIFGLLLQRGLVPDGGIIPMERLTLPKAEAEVAFLVGPLPPQPGHFGVPVIKAVAPALEIVDSRYSGGKPQVADLVADNVSAAAFVCGAWVAPPADLSNLGTALGFDGRIVRAASTAAVLGGCVRAVALCARHLAEQGLDRPDSDWIILAGSPFEAVPIEPGMHVRAEIEGLGSASAIASGAGAGE